MSWNQSLERYDEIVLRKGKSAAIRKLNLGETLEFIARYNHFIGLQPGRERRRALKELSSFCLLKKPFILTERDRLKIVYAAKNYASLPALRRNGRSKHRENWLQRLLAYFASNFGYSKEQTLGLYPEEVPPLIEEREKLRLSERIVFAGLVHSPAETLKSLSPEEDAVLDRRKFDDLKRFQNSQKKR